MRYISDSHNWWASPYDNEDEDPFDDIDAEEFYENELDDDEKDEVDEIEEEHGEEARMEKLCELWHKKHDYDPSDWEDDPDEEVVDDRYPYHYPDPNYKDPPSTYGK